MPMYADSQFISAPISECKTCVLIVPIVNIIIDIYG